MHLTTNFFNRLSVLIFEVKLVKNKNQERENNNNNKKNASIHFQEISWSIQKSFGSSSYILNVCSLNIIAILVRTFLS